jgi:hypothetical protein
VAGVVGRKMPRYHLFGETVTIANEMETQGLPGQVCISHVTYEALGEFRDNYFSFQSLPHYQRKNGTHVGRCIVKLKRHTPTHSLILDDEVVQPIRSPTAAAAGITSIHRRTPSQNHSMVSGGGARRRSSAKDYITQNNNGGGGGGNESVISGAHNSGAGHVHGYGHHERVRSFSYNPNDNNSMLLSADPPASQRTGLHAPSSPSLSTHPNSSALPLSPLPPLPLTALMSPSLLAISPPVMMIGGGGNVASGHYGRHMPTGGHTHGSALPPLRLSTAMMNPSPTPPPLPGGSASGTSTPQPYSMTHTSHHNNNNPPTNLLSSHGGVHLFARLARDTPSPLDSNNNRTSGNGSGTSGSNGPITYHTHTLGITGLKT